MAAPVRLVTKPTSDQKTKEDIVACLEATLAEAKEGKLLGLVIVAKDADGWAQRAAHSLTLHEEIGALEVIKTERVLQLLGTFQDE
jgi:hypothetical protein